MFVAYAIGSALLFGLLYGETVLARSGSFSTALLCSGVTVVFMLASFLAPRSFFRYTSKDVAPIVMTRVVTRAGISSAIVILMSVLIVLLSRVIEVSFLSEIYFYTLMAVLLFHGLGGAFADHVIYLQRTGQYNSNQLAAILLLVTLMLFVLALYFFSFDLSPTGPPHALGRDLIAITTALVGYGWAIYGMAHH